MALKTLVAMINNPDTWERIMAKATRVRVGIGGWTYPLWRDNFYPKGAARNKNERKKIYLMTDFCINKSYDSVPDPYFGGDAGFELAFDILEDACEGLLKKIHTNL